MARNKNMVPSQIQWPRDLWRRVRETALRADTTAADYVRKAVREKLERDKAAA